jgi:sulfide:quinone oxidoreductase
MSPSHSDRWEDRPLVLIAGGGVAALEAMLALDNFAAGRVRMQLLAPTRELVYRPLLVSEPFGGSTAPVVALDTLLRDRPVRYVHDALAELRPERRRVRTTRGVEHWFDALLIATGAHAAAPAMPGALTFDGADGVAAYRALLAELDRGAVRRVVYAVPPGSGWTLPLYELALLTAGHLFERRIAGAELTVVTAEPAPLDAFGDPAGRYVRGLLGRNGSALRTDAGVSAASADGLVLADGTCVPADRVVALPRVEGPAIPGLPRDPAGFLPVDEHGRVAGLEHVYAAGDVTSGPIKQGGLATQQADVAAAAIAAWAGAPIHASPYRPVLRGLLMTDEEPVFLRAERFGAHDVRSLAGTSPLWWPGAKIAGRYLTSALAAHGDVGVPPDVRRLVGIVTARRGPRSRARLRG